jgi:DNA-binding NarL/FixJ family response regulator
MLENKDLQRCQQVLKDLEAQRSIAIDSLRAFQELVAELDRLVPGIFRLNDREMQIFELIGSGLTVKEIGERLEISQKTAECYRDNIRKKMELENSHKLSFVAFRWMTGRSGASEKA